ncbi:DUF222 domain-containing protein [Amycolatopsis taiwanensis]|uniref:DUF222 domain-containing protein n=1 Tax=Amycolatopsis taiwanensis TaxID=342230 RepID=UPI0004B87258|nr:DUF222 domain-containing protein [Amycolatopsis taiwanensis]
MLSENSVSTPEQMLVDVLTAEEMSVYCVYEPDLVDPFPETPARVLARRGLLRRIQSTQAQVNRLQAMQYEAVAEFARKAEDRSAVARELALALAISPRMAENQIELAEALVSRLPETLKAMQRGEIDAYKAGRIHEPSAALTDEQAREVDAIMAGRIGRKDPTGLRRSATLAVAKVDPDGYAQRCARRRAQRGIELIPQGEGMVKLCANLPIEVGAAAYARIDAQARRRRKADTTKTLGQHRADLFADLLLKDTSGLTVGPKAEVFIYMDVYTWLNLNTKPAEMAGVSSRTGLHRPALREPCVTLSRHTAPIARSDVVLLPSASA